MLAPCAPVGCPLRPATAGPGPPDRARSRTAAQLPRPPRWPCPQRHDTARDKITFACGPCRSVVLRGMRPQSSADRRIWSVPCRGALPKARIRESARAPQAMPPVQEKASVGEAPEPAVPRRPAATNSPIDPQRIIDPARGAVLTSRAVVRAAQRLTSDIRRSARPDARQGLAADWYRWNFRRGCAARILTLGRQFPGGPAAAHPASRPARTRRRAAVLLRGLSGSS